MPVSVEQEPTFVGIDVAQARADVAFCPTTPGAAAPVSYRSRATATKTRRLSEQMRRGQSLRREVNDIPVEVARRVWNEGLRDYEVSHHYNRAR